jgi:DNA-binding FadR family transcriptional regulator
MIHAATLQARLDAELQEHRAVGRAIYDGDRRLAAGVIKEHPDGRREEVAFDA